MNTQPDGVSAMSAELGDALKPCPYCSAAGLAVLFELWDTFDAGHTASVHCSRCGSFGPSVYGERGVKAACEDARKKWNQRATPNTTDEPRRSAASDSITELG